MRKSSEIYGGADSSKAFYDKRQEAARVFRLFFPIQKNNFKSVGIIKHRSLKADGSISLDFFQRPIH